ncbi:transposase [Hymenobacter arcticus]
MASENRSTLAAARALNIDPKRLYAWQKAARQPLPADPAEVRALRQANKRLAQELETLKKPALSSRPSRRRKSVAVC